MEPKDTEKPSRTMPTRRSFLVTRASGACRRRGSSPTLAATHAQADRPGEHADGGHEPVTEQRATEAERQDGGDDRGAAPRRRSTVAAASALAGTVIGCADGQRSSVTRPRARA